MADVKKWLAGFVYRGRAPWEAGDPSYHVEVGEYVKIPGRDPVVLGQSPMTPEAASAAGFDLPSVLSAINGEVMAQCAGLHAQMAEQAAATQAEREAVIAERDQATTARDAASEQVKKLNGEIAHLRAELVKAFAKIDELQPPSVQAPG